MSERLLKNSLFGASLASDGAHRPRQHDARRRERGGAGVQLRFGRGARPRGQPLRVIQRMADDVLEQMGPAFEKLYSRRASSVNSSSGGRR